MTKGKTQADRALRGLELLRRERRLSRIGPAMIHGIQRRLEPRGVDLFLSLHDDEEPAHEPRLSALIRFGNQDYQIGSDRSLRFVVSPREEAALGLMGYIRSTGHRSTISDSARWPKAVSRAGP